MKISRKHQLLIVLMLVWACTCVYGESSKQPKTEVKLEIGSEEQSWLVGTAHEKAGKGPIKPTHVAIAFLRYRNNSYRNNFPNFHSPITIKSFLSTTAGKLLSQKQIELLSTGYYCISRLGKFGDTVGNHYQCRLYAVTEEDARNMAKAFVELLTNKAEAEAQPLRKQLVKIQEQLSRAKEEMPEKESEAKIALATLIELRKNVPYYSPKDARDAKEATLDLNKMLVILDIEIAGIKARIAEIEKYQAKIQDKNTLAKLEQLMAEQNIELAGSLAKQAQTATARERAREYENLTNLSISASNLKDHILLLEGNIRRLQRVLAEPERIPPELFQNKVTIHPVSIEN